jgi:arylsulfatase A-like enzyme
MNIDNRNGVIMRTLFATVACLIFGTTAAQAAEPRRPNVVLFLIDDQDKSSIGAFGGTTYTPHLDRMAREGMTFSRAYVSSAVCTPSRYGWATGRYAGNSTSRLYDEACGGRDQQGDPNFNMALESDRMNLGNVLREAGYATGWVGKFHLDSDVDFPEFYRGDDGFRKISKDAEATSETSALFAHNERVLRRYIENLGFSWAKHVYRGNLEPPYNSHNSEWTVEAALEFIEANRERPFYLHYCTTLLHGTDKSWRRSMDNPLVSGEGALDALPKSQTPRDKLLAEVEAAGFDPDSATAGEAWVDDAIEAVLAKLKQLGLDDDTLVLFAPDHGRRGKSSLFSQDGVCIPMIARLPGHIPAGATCDELVENVDWAPTVLEAAGVAKPAGYRIDGQSFLQLLLGRNDAPARDHVYVEMGCARGVATKKWKYIAVRYPQEQVDRIQSARPDHLPRLMTYIGRLGIGSRGAERAGFWDADQLYDLQNDPDERTNLAADPQYADMLARMKEMLTADLKTSGRPFGEFVPGGNAAPPGQIDAQIAQVKKMIIQGKRVIVPDDVDTNDPPSRADQRKAERKKKREESKAGKVGKR